MRKEDVSKKDNGQEDESKKDSGKCGHGATELVGYEYSTNKWGGQRIVAKYKCGKCPKTWEEIIEP